MQVIKTYDEHNIIILLLVDITYSKNYIGKSYSKILISYITLK